MSGSLRKLFGSPPINGVLEQWLTDGAPAPDPEAYLYRGSRLPHGVYCFGCAEGAARLDGSDASDWAPVTLGEWACRNCSAPAAEFVRATLTRDGETVWQRTYTAVDAHNALVDANWQMRLRSCGVVLLGYIDYGNDIITASYLEAPDLQVERHAVWTIQTAPIGGAS